MEVDMKKFLICILNLFYIYETLFWFNTWLFYLFIIIFDGQGIVLLIWSYFWY